MVALAQNDWYLTDEDTTWEPKLSKRCWIIQHKHRPTCSWVNWPTIPPDKVLLDTDTALSWCNIVKVIFYRVKKFVKMFGIKIVKKICYSLGIFLAGNQLYTVKNIACTKLAGARLHCTWGLVPDYNLPIVIGSIHIVISLYWDCNL